MLKQTLFCLLTSMLGLSIGCGSNSEIPLELAHSAPSQSSPAGNSGQQPQPDAIETVTAATGLTSPFVLQHAKAEDVQPGQIRLASADSETPAEKKKEELVTARVLLEYDKLPAGDVCRGVVLLQIKEGWHINTNPAKPDFLIPTAVSLKSKLKTELSDLKYPKGKELTVQGFDQPLHVYEGQVRIDCQLAAPLISAGQVDELEVLVKYQPCNDVRCLAPKTISLKGKIRIGNVGEVPKPINDRYFRNPDRPKP